jgi:cytochrome c556
MKKTTFALLGATLLAGGAAPAQTSGSAEPFHVRETMQQQVNPAIMEIWDIGNAAMDEAGGIDPALMDDAKWSTLAAAAGRLEESGRQMAAAQQLRAAREDNWATEDFEVTMEQVQAALDADPAAFRSLAADFAEHVGELEAAAEAKDFSRTSELVAAMDAECAACHAQFWYAE